MTTGKKEGTNMEQISLIFMYTMLALIPIALAVHVYIAILWIIEKIGIADEFFDNMGGYK